MLVNKAFKFRIYPNSEQQIQINKTLGCSRFVFNHFLDVSKTAKYQGYNYCSKELTVLKNKLLWLKEADKFALQNSLKDLNASYKNFFGKRGKYPKFKSKRNQKNSYRTNFTNNNIEIRENYIKLPKLKWVQFANSREVQGRIISVTISKTNTEKYFVSICCEVEVLPLPEISAQTGIDLGLKSYATTSDGVNYNHPKALLRLEKKLKKLQKSYSRKKKDSKNQNKCRQKIALLHERIANIRMDYIHKLSTKLINENQVIVMESLNTLSMLKNKRLAKQIADASWGEFARQVEYKSLWYGRTFMQVDTYYPSSQTCSGCGYIHADVKDLSVRIWVCPKCNETHDRDKNSAVNILNEGLKNIKIA